MMVGILVIFVVLIVAIAALYNILVKHRNRVSAAWSDIDVQLTRRHDLVPNLLETVKGYQRYEGKVLEDITRLRSSAELSPLQRGQQENHITQQIISIFVLAEDYPELKSNEAFQQLHQSLIEIEDHLQFARRYYNGAVRDNNIAVQSFPNHLVAGWFGFTVAEFFELELASQKTAPKVVL